MYGDVVDAHSRYSSSVPTYSLDNDLGLESQSRARVCPRRFSMDTALRSDRLVELMRTRIVCWPNKLRPRTSRTSESKD